VPYLLHIESTSTVCSVAVSNNNELVSIKELNNGYTHAENLHVFIEHVLKDAGIQAKDLSAVSVSSGPGSYTGLRIGFSAAKGLAFALQIPLISIDTLKALTNLVIRKKDAGTFYCPLLDARRMEVYTAMYDAELKEIMPVCAMVLNEEIIQVFKKEHPVYFFGDGMPKAKELLQTLPNAFFLDDVTASATAMVALAYQKYLAQDFEDVAYSEPNYLKEFFFTAAKK
jgi:tRNA threonylcarbamoyladenosine biosynthesis protein TsaB